MQTSELGESSSILSISCRMQVKFSRAIAVDRDGREKEEINNLIQIAHL